MNRLETETPERARGDRVDGGNLARQVLAHFEPVPSNRPRAQEHQLDFGDVAALYGRAPESSSPAERERANLARTAAERILDPAARRQFEQNMTRFEASAAERGLTQEQIAQTYRHINRMLSADVAALPQAQRNRIGMQILEHAADPSGIDQSRFNTCGVATIQERVFTRNPEIGAEMIASAATLGRWTSTDGRVVQLDRRSLQQDFGEIKQTDQESPRTQASRIFQMTALNDIYQRIDPDLRVVTRPPNRDSKDDTGERIQYRDGRPFPEGQGESQTPFLGTHMQYIAEQAARLGQHDVVLRNPYGSRRLPGVSDFSTPQELHDLLSRAAQRGNLPLIIGVDANHPIFGQHDPEMRGMAPHVISITGYDPATGRITISNQWGRGRDFQTNLHQLYEATFQYAWRNRE